MGERQECMKEEIRESDNDSESATGVQSRADAYVAAGTRTDEDVF